MISCIHTPTAESAYRLQLTTLRLTRNIQACGEMVVKSETGTNIQKFSDSRERESVPVEAEVFSGHQIHWPLKMADAGGKQLPMSKYSTGKRSTTTSINEEYRNALRTKSYTEIWSKIHRRYLNRSTSTPTTATQDDSFTALSPPLSTSFTHLRSHLLEPTDQEALLEAVGGNPQLYSLFLDYFDTSLEACAICSSLLTSIDRIRRRHHTIRRLLRRATSCTAVDQYSTSLVAPDLASYVELENPLLSLNSVKFRRIHDLYGSLIQRLALSHRRLMRREKAVRVFKKAAGITLVVVCGAVAVAILVFASHAVIGALAAGPALVGPAAAWVRRVMGPVRASELARLAEQVDAAAKGAFVMSRDMETMSRMVTRLHDEIEHGKDVIRMWLRSREGYLLREVVKEVESGAAGFVEQLDELEEHVSWCLLTINRTRRLVAQEITRRRGEPSSATNPTTSPTTTAV